MNKFPLITLAAATLLGLASFDAPAQAQWTGAAQRQGAPVTPETLRQTRWIADGRDDAPLKVYVFLDANCVYCAKFWADARPWVDAALSGASTVDQLRSNLRAVEIEWDDALEEELSGLVEPSERYWDTRSALTWT